MLRYMALALLAVVGLGAIQEAKAQVVISNGRSRNFVVVGGGNQALVVGNRGFNNQALVVNNGFGRQAVVVGNHGFNNQALVVGGRQAFVVNNGGYGFNNQALILNRNAFVAPRAFVVNGGYGGAALVNQPAFLVGGGSCSGVAGQSLIVNPSARRFIFVN